MAVRKPLRKSLRRIPSFRLYGEAEAASGPPRLHIEDIQARSRIYRWEIAAHTHRGLYQCLFLQSGPARASVDGESLLLHGPALVLLPPATVHAFSFDASTSGYVLTLAAELFGAAGDETSAGALRQLFASAHVVGLERELPLAQRLQRLLMLLAAEFRQPESHDAPICQWLAQGFLWLAASLLLRRHELAPAQQRRAQHLQRFQELLARHHADHWTVPRYARALGLTTRRLNHLALAHGGCSAFELIQRRLVLEAQRRLTYVAMPVRQVAQELGFRDAAYFCRFFRRHTGHTPRGFRQRHSQTGV